MVARAATPALALPEMQGLPLSVAPSCFHSTRPQSSHCPNSDRCSPSQAGAEHQGLVSPWTPLQPGRSNISWAGKVSQDFAMSPLSSPHSPQSPHLWPPSEMMAPWCPPAPSDTYPRDFCNPHNSSQIKARRRGSHMKREQSRNVIWRTESSSMPPLKLGVLLQKLSSSANSAHRRPVAAQGTKSRSSEPQMSTPAATPHLIPEGCVSGPSISSAPVEHETYTTLLCLRKLK